MKIETRTMIIDDAEQINLLSKQLGYPLSLQQTLQNITAVTKSGDHTAFVAVHENKIVGWIGVAYTIMLEVMPHCEINGLVIDENYRGKGVGKLLIGNVKQWAKNKGVNKLSLHCNIKRAEANLFYKHLGFTEVKQQKNWVLNI
jgi:GNAT superfamily N-acetyltransferase